MKKTLLFAVLAFLALGPAYGGTITVTQPAGGDVALGTACPISWIATAITSNVRINLITPGGRLVGNIIGNQAPDSSPYIWTVSAPAVAGERYRVRVTASDGSGMGESAVFTVVAGGGDPGDPEDPEDPTPPGAGITVTQPSAGSSWRPGTRQTLTWTKSGNMPFMVQITLRREGAPETEEPVLRIADGCANNGSRIWFIPDSLAEGRYFVRVRASRTLRGDSAVFAIDAAGTRGEAAGPITPIRCDLEMPGVGVEYYNGNIVAWVKNNGPDSLRYHDVKFRLNFPEGGRGEQIITRTISVPVGSEEGVPLMVMVRSAIPDAGLRTSVRIDTALSHIVDPNPLNQHRDVRLYADNRTPIDLAITISNQRVSQVIGGGDLHEGIPHHKYRLRATLHLRNNSSAPAEITRVSCRWKEEYRTDSGWSHYPETHAHGTLTLGPFRPGEDITREIELEYKTYTFEMERRIHFELDPDRLLNDPNRGNNEVRSVIYDVR